MEKLSAKYRNALRLVAGVALAAGFTACASGDMEPPPQEDPGTARFKVRESVQQLQVTHADPGAELAVYDANGMQLAKGTADKQGSFIFRRLPAGKGYQVRVVGSSPLEYSRALHVFTVDESKPQQNFYSDQKLQAGFNYITTRDGTQLSAYVTLPGPIENGPYPTVVAYSGYDPSRPGEKLGDYEFLCDKFPTLCDAPNDPSSLIISLFGYATVSVNIRGTGCSGGAYDYFETLQLLDGYDVVETVAAQPFVKFHKVGMTGISFPGISQLFTAWVHPPSLAAITPLSVIGNTATTLMPGGILNSGFAISWVTSVLNRADPYGQGWEKKRVDGGDMVCGENQLLHSQKVDNVAMAQMQMYYDPALVDPVNPTAFVQQIDVPVFLAGAWHDEQTGPYFTTLFDRFTKSPLVRFTVYNGVHQDGFAPSVLGEWLNFLDFHVAKRIPKIDPQLRTLAPLLFKEVYKADLPLPPDRFDAYKTFEEALAAYRSEPNIRVLFESGGMTDPGAPVPTFEKKWKNWPPETTMALRYFFKGDGSMSEQAPMDPSSASSFKNDSTAGDKGNLANGGDVNDKLPKYDYRPLVDGKAAAFVTAPLADDLVLVGTASADLWVRSTADDADLQVVINEVRPDGKEMYVQAGWLRASYRGLGPDSTELWPSQTMLEKDHKMLPAGQWEKTRVAIPGMSHVFRKGSRIRVSVDTPGNTRPAWRFKLLQFPNEVTHAISHSQAYPSSIVLPRQAAGAVTVPPALPACPSLRGQPCRAYTAYANTPATFP